MYEKKVYRHRNSNEYEFSFPGEYGAKGEKRAKRKKATREQVKRQNQWRRERQVRRDIEDNFEPGDLWETLKYPKGTRKPFNEIVHDMEKFINLLRKEYKKRGLVLKWYNRIEIGERGGIHMHIIINRMDGKPDTDIVAQEIWGRISGGRINHTNLYAAGGYKELSKYITKLPNEEQEEQLSVFEPAERKKMIRYSHSRNLVRKQPEKEKSRWRTVRRMIRDGIKPTEGYYIDPESVYYGTNPFNGMTYLKYIECRLGTLDGTAAAPIKPEWRACPGEEGG